MQRPPILLVLLMLAGAVLGGWMAWDGLHARLFGDFLRLQGQIGWWAAIPRAVQAEPLALAWPLVALGAAWFGALSGLWLKLRWGYRATIVLALVSLLYLGPGTVLGLVILICLWAGRLRRWGAAVQE